jgi:hypothetical protein
MTKRKVRKAIESDDLIMDEKKPVLCIDVMHWVGKRFFVKVCRLLQLHYSEKLKERPKIH